MDNMSIFNTSSNLKVKTQDTEFKNSYFVNKARALVLSTYVFYWNKWYYMLSVELKKKGLLYQRVADSTHGPA